MGDKPKIHNVIKFCHFAAKAEYFRLIATLSMKFEVQIVKFLLFAFAVPERYKPAVVLVLYCEESKIGR